MGIKSWLSDHPKWRTFIIIFITLSIAIPLIAFSFLFIEIVILIGGLILLGLLGYFKDETERRD